MLRGSPPVSPPARSNPGGDATAPAWARGARRWVSAAEGWGGDGGGSPGATGRLDGWMEHAGRSPPQGGSGVWLWQRHMAWLGFTLCPWFLQTRGKGVPAALHLCSGMEGKAGRGMAKSNGLWSPLLQAPSSSFSQLLPSPLHCTLQDELFVCHLAPPQHLCRAEGWGRWV